MDFDLYRKMLQPRTFRYVTIHPGQLSLAIPPWVDAMSISENWDVIMNTYRSI